MKHSIYALGLGLLFTTTACVDLNQEPQSFLTEEEYYSMPRLDVVQKSVAGLAYSTWFDNYGYSCRRLRLEVSAGEMLPQFAKVNNPLGNVYELYPNQSSIDKDSEQLWRNFWTIIYGSNKIIAGTPIPTDENEQAFKSVVAEANFMRAFAYFNLVRIFGDVPKIKTPEETLIKDVKRSPVAEIYDEIILPDLAFACENLPDKSRTGSSDSPSKWAAKTMLADVYMTLAGWPLKRDGYYAKAAEEALAVVDHFGTAGLTPKYADLWKESLKTTDKEHLFAVHNSVAYKIPSQYGKSFYSADHQYGGWGDYFASPIFVENHPNDDRLAHDFAKEWLGKDKKTIVKYEKSANKCPLIVKFSDYNSFNSKGVLSQLSDGITPVYRLADAFLMYAEASNLAEGAPNQKAKDCLKAIQDRANYPDAERPSVDGFEAFDKAVFEERGWEFYAEGKRWFELVRREKVGEYRNRAPKTSTDKGIDEEYGMFYDKSLYKANNHYYLPIPMAEIEMTGWTNNAGY